MAKKRLTLSDLAEAGNEVQKAIRRLSKGAKAGSAIESAVEDLKRGLNKTVVEILANEENYSLLSLNLDPSRSQDWENDHAVLVVAYGDIKLQIPVRALRELDGVLTMEIKKKMATMTIRKNEIGPDDVRVKYAGQYTQLSWHKFCVRTQLGAVNELSVLNGVDLETNLPSVTLQEAKYRLAEALSYALSNLDALDISEPEVWHNRWGHEDYAGYEGRASIVTPEGLLSNIRFVISGEMSRDYIRGGEYISREKAEELFAASLRSQLRAVRLATTFNEWGDLDLYEETLPLHTDWADVPPTGFSESADEVRFHEGSITWTIPATQWNKVDRVVFTIGEDHVRGGDLATKVRGELARLNLDLNGVKVSINIDAESISASTLSFEAEGQVIFHLPVFKLMGHR